MRFWRVTRSLVPANALETRENQGKDSKYNYIRGTYNHAYGKRKTSDSNKKFLEIENEHILTVQTILMDKTYVKLLFNFHFVEVMNSKSRVNQENLDVHVVKIHVCCFP